MSKTCINYIVEIKGHISYVIVSMSSIVMDLVYYVVAVVVKDLLNHSGRQEEIKFIIEL